MQQAKDQRGTQRGGRVYVPNLGGWYARIPGWHSRSRWLGVVARWAHSRSGRRICQRHRTDPDTLVAIATVLARFADHDTGRQCAPGQQTVADESGCSRKTVQRVEDALAAGALLVLVHGSPYYNRAMNQQYRQLAKRLPGLAKPRWCTRVRALTLPRPAVTHVEHVPIPAEGRVVIDPSDSAYSPSAARARPGAAPRPKKQAPRRGGPPIRPIGLQRFAAELVRRLPQLARYRHIGAVCDVLSGAGFSAERWTVDALLARIAETAPIPTADRMRSPLGFLRSALGRIDPAEETPIEVARRCRAKLKAEQSASAALGQAEAAAAVSLVESSAYEKIAAELARIAARPRRHRDLPTVPRAHSDR